MALVTKGKTFINGEIVTPTKIHALVDSATVTNIATADITDDAITTAKIADANVTTAKIANANVTTAKIADANVTTAKLADSSITSAKIADGTLVNADISASAAIADTKLATISTAGKVANSATTATSANSANAIVARNASGNFNAGTVTANLTGNVTGNASTASKLATARTITLGGDLSGSVSFDGSSNKTLTATVANNSHTHDAGNINSGTLNVNRIPTGTTSTTVCIGNDTRLVPPGAIMPFAMNSAPTGWLAANGTAVSRSTYATLFAAIGTTYGAGNGSTTFHLPDLRGYFIRGYGTNSDGTGSGGGFFGAKQADAFQGHYHGVLANTFQLESGTNIVGGNGSVRQTSQNKIIGPITDGTNGTPRTASETRPRNIALLYCIKF